MRICETFRSLQGEGRTIGALTYFVRTAGCNLSCAWCDTRYAASGGEERTVDELVEMAAGDRNVCLTGGEPLLQSDAPELLRRLADAGKTVVLETNGSVDISRVPDSERIIISMDIKCPASGMSDRMLFSNIARLRPKDQLKFVICDGADLQYAIDVVAEHRPACEVVFSPVGGMDLEPLAEEVIDRRLDVRVLPQLHKLIWGDKRAV